MIPYQLAKQLKDAGFPQPQKDVVNLDIPIGVAFIDETHCGYFKNGEEWNDDWIYIPTLAELIEACGEVCLFHPSFDEENKWRAQSKRPEVYGRGSTDEEAVANLWLQLNKN